MLISINVWKKLVMCAEEVCQMAVHMYQYGGVPVQCILKYHVTKTKQNLYELCPGCITAQQIGHTFLQSFPFPALSTLGFQCLVRQCTVEQSRLVAAECVIELVTINDR